MHLFPRFKDLQHAFLVLDVDEQAQRPIWYDSLQKKGPSSLGVMNKELVLDTLWKSYRWQELIEQPDESMQGEHLVIYRPMDDASGAERRLLVSTGKILKVGHPGGTIYNKPFFREHLWDEEASIDDAQRQAAICRFTGVQPRSARRLLDVVDSLGPRLEEIIRFTVAPTANGEDKAECIFECVWRFLASLHPRGVDFVIGISETRSAVIRLYRALGERLRRPVIQTVASSMLLNQETGIERETILYFLATAPFHQHVPLLSADERAWIISHLRRPGPAGMVSKNSMGLQDSNASGK